MTSHDPDDIKLAETVRRIFDEQASFNRVLGLTVRSITPERVEMDLPMRDELVGNYVHGTLHGGVTSAALDATGGLAAFLSIIRKKLEDGPCDPVEQALEMQCLDLSCARPFDPYVLRGKAFSLEDIANRHDTSVGKVDRRLLLRKNPF